MLKPAVPRHDKRPGDLWPRSYASFDGGITWKGPIKTFTASPSFPTAQQNNV